MNMDAEHEKPEGTFIGHIIPGTFLLLLGFWWSCNVIVSFVIKQKAHKQFQARCWYPWPVWPTIHMESLCKIFACLIGIAIELLWREHANGLPRPLFDDKGRFKARSLNNYQHAAMYFSFVLSGGADLMENFYKRAPRGMSQVFLAYAFLVESILMGFHLKGSGLDRMAHLLLVYSMLATVAGTLLEMWQPKSFFVALVRPASMVLQGTWFIQLAYILYNNSPAWDQHEHAGAMFVPVVFCYHLTVIFIGHLTVYLLADWWFYRNGSSLPTLVDSDSAEDEELDMFLKESSPTHRSMVQMSNKRTHNDRSPYDI